MKTLIVEDELLLAEMLSEILADFGFRDVVKVHSYDEALATLSQGSGFELAILDVNLGTGKTGVDLAAWLQKNYPIPVFYLTSYSDKQTLTKAAKTQPNSYLLKPVRPPELLAALTLLKERQLGGDEILTFKDGFKTIRLPLSEVLFIRADGVYLNLETCQKRYVLRNSLGKFLQEFDLPELKRVHRSYAVNLNQITEYDTQNIWIQSNKIPISRTYKKEVLSLLK